jgi:hypothetical protein
MLVLMLSCNEKSQEFIPDKESFSGTLFQVDRFGNKTPARNARVTLLEKNLVTSANDSGRWSFSNLPSDTYSISFEKQGFRSTKVKNFVFIENVGYSACVISQNIVEPPDFVITRLDTARFTFDPIPILLKVSLQRPYSTSRFYMCFFDTKPSVSSNEENYRLIYSVETGVLMDTIDVIPIDRSSLVRNGLQIGDTVYAIVYGRPRGSEASGIFNCQTGRFSFNHLTEPTNRVRFVIR